MNKLIAPLILLLGSSQSTTMGLQHKSAGIFDKVVDKMNEKERALAQYTVEHQKNLVKAQQQAALIAAGQLDASIYAGEPKTIDDEISQNLEMIDSAPLEKLAGMKQSKKHEKRQPGTTLSGESAPEQSAQPAQSLVQTTSTSQVKAKKPAKQPVEEDEERDDFEGFGSITELVKNKDTLVKRTLDSEEFKQEMAQKEAAKQAQIEAEQKAKLVKEKAAKIKKNMEKKKTLASAKAKIEAALNKAALKKTLAQKLSKKMHAAPVAAAAVEEAPEPAANEPSISVSSYKQVLASVLAPKPKHVDHVKVEPAVVTALGNVAANEPSENVEEQRGFIGQYSSKVSAQEQAKIDAKKAEEDALIAAKPQIPHSASAPGHKGMLARAMEKDMKEQEAREAKEKEDLMQAALNDPAFKIQMDALEAQKAATPLL